MPKYKIDISYEQDCFDLDTDEFKDELAEAEVDPNDPDAIHDWIRDQDTMDVMDLFNSSSPTILTVGVRKPT